MSADREAGSLSPENARKTSVQELVREVYLFAVFFRNAEDRALRGFGLTSSQFVSLYQLWRCGEMTVGELIRRTSSTPGNMTVVLRNLERNGYVSRKANPEDGRSFIVCLTDKGQELVDQVRPEYYRYFAEILTDLPDESVERFKTSLRDFNRRQMAADEDPPETDGGPVDKGTAS